MRYLMSILFIFASLSMYGQPYNQVDSLGLKSGFWTEKIDSIIIRGNYKMGKKEGTWTYFIDDKLIKILNYSNDTLSGYCMRFNKDGSLYRKFRYRNNKLNGLCEFYSSKGELLAQYEYVNNTIFELKLYIIDDEMPPCGHNYTPTL